MSKLKVSTTILFDYEERRRALLADGYIQRHETVLGDGVVCRLVHRSNGNNVTLSVSGNKLVQRTNGIIKHSQTY